MKTEYKAGDKVVMTRDGHGLKAGDVCEFIKYFDVGMAYIRNNEIYYIVDLNIIKPLTTNSATIAGRTYQIPDEKVDQVKKLVDPGMPKWWDLPALKLPTVPYKLYKAAKYVNEGWKPDWDVPMQDKYRLCYNGNKFVTEICWLVSHGIPVFKSKAAALRAVELFRANGDYDELVKFYQS